MRVAHLVATAMLLFSVAPTGCATVIGLDNGVPLPDDGGDDPLADANNADGSTGTDSGGLVCAANTADCNGQAGDGCETTLGTPMHCSSCTDACPGGKACTGGQCCANQNQTCVLDSDCCSNQCKDSKCDKSGG